MGEWKQEERGVQEAEERVREKKRLRREVRDLVSGLDPSYCEEADREITRLALSLPEYQRADTVFCYVGTSREINTRMILEQVLRDGKRLGTPKCVEKGRMEVYQIRDMSDLKEGKYGIMEPVDGCALILPEEIGIALIPCLTCTMDGRRLGYGGGYYDRYLVGTPFAKAVLCRERIMQKEIPMAAYDVQIPIVISENHIWRGGTAS